MATNYPTTLDDATSLPVEAASTALSVNHVTAHQNIQDALEAVEAKVGVDSSAVTTSHDYKLSAVTGSDKALKSGTSTQSVTGLTLASPKITVGSDAVGDLHYTSNVDGTQSRLGKGNDNQILKMNGTALNWEDEITTVNASTTAAGIVELATTAQVTAGTATGETGAALVVTPDGLAASTPVFSGLGITNTTRITRLAGYSPASNTTENTVYTTTITGGVLSTNGIIKVRTPIYFGTNATAETWTIRLKYGGTTLFTNTVTCTAIGGGSGVGAYGFIDAFIINSGATNTQDVGFYITLAPQVGTGANPVYPTTGHSTDTTSAIDTTSNQTLTMTVQRTNGGGGGGTFYQTLVETIKNA